jgi:class 3 adenylate cyclase
MSTRTEIDKQVTAIVRGDWSTTKGRVVPDVDRLTLGNDAIELEATVLYTDLAGSTAMVDAEAAWFAAEVYKTFLYAAAKVIRANGGEIVAYDGDRVMAVFVGDDRNSAAAKSGLQINWAVKKLVSPALRTQYVLDDDF